MKREQLLPIGGRTLDLPCFFPAISTIKTNFSPAEYLDVLLAVKQQQLLISAYDIHNADPKQKSAINRLLKKAQKEEVGILLDSGNYESYWLRDTNWTTKDFHSILEDDKYDLVFSFDIHNPPGAKKKIVNSVESSVLLDQENCGSGTVIPIIHATSKQLPDVVVDVAERLHPIMVAVPERTLGDGLKARTELLVEIRAKLEKLDHYIPIHLLGTGHPTSILLLALAGADSFDGLEWCKTTVDHTTGQLYHFQQREFFGDQSAFCCDYELPYTIATLGHNLLFYRKWLKMIQEAISKASCKELIRKYVPKAFMKSLPDHVQEILEVGANA